MEVGRVMREKLGVCREIEPTFIERGGGGGERMNDREGERRRLRERDRKEGRECEFKREGGRKR